MLRLDVLIITVPGSSVEDRSFTKTDMDILCRGGGRGGGEIFYKFICKETLRGTFMTFNVCMAENRVCCCRENYIKELND